MTTPGHDYSREKRPVELDSINFCAAKILRRECRFRVISVISSRGTDVRFTPNSDRLLRGSEVTLCAISERECGATNPDLVFAVAS
jgi:hypothetical protein